jgi:HEPN domain-containing protein
MPPDARSREVAGEWLRRAQSDLVLAKQPRPGDVFWEDLCFHAEQAAEKALKAVLVVDRTDFPRTHDISEILELLTRAGHTVPADVLMADTLSDYATVTRYPGDRQPVSEEEYRRAVAVAEDVVGWARVIIHAG